MVLILSTLTADIVCCLPKTINCHNTCSNYLHANNFLFIIKTLYICKFSASLEVQLGESDDSTEETVTYNRKAIATTVMQNQGLYSVLHTTNCKKQLSSVTDLHFPCCQEYKGWKGMMWWWGQHGMNTHARQWQFDIFGGPII